MKRIATTHKELLKDPEYVEIWDADVTEEMDRLNGELSKLREENASLKKLVKDICDEWTEDCEESCDSWGHAEKCKAVNIATAKKAMREHIERAKAVIDAARALVNSVHEIGIAGNQRFLKEAIEAYDNGIRRVE